MAARRRSPRQEKREKKYQVLPGLEPGSKDSESLVMTITLQDLDVLLGGVTREDAVALEGGMCVRMGAPPGIGGIKGV